MPDKTDKAVIATSATGGVVAATGGAFTLAGFTSSGIAAGSAAAASQAAVGNVAAGSFFATVQSLGAIGTFATLTTGGLIAVGVGAGYGGYKFYKWLTKPNSSKCI